MLTPEQQQPEAVVAALRPVIPSIYRALERAHATAGDHLSEHGRSVADGADSKTLHSSLVRYHFKRELRDTDLEVPEVRVDDIENIGVRFTVGDMTLWLLKEREGCNLPPRTTSEGRSYCHQRLFEDDIEHLNLVLEWRLDDDEVLVDIVCPEGVSPNGWSADIHWRIPLPHPAELPVELLKANSHEEQDIEGICLREDEEEPDDSDLVGIELRDAAAAK